MKHPYEQLEGGTLWRALEVAVSELERNSDVTVQTSRQLVVGYLSQQVVQTHPLFDLLAKLDHARISYSISRYRSDTVMVAITIVGERIEIVVFADGHMEVSRFTGSEDIVGGSELVDRLIEENRG